MAELLGQELIKEFLALFFVFFLFLCGTIWKSFANFLKKQEEHNLNVDKKLDRLDEKIDSKFNEVSDNVVKLKKDSDKADCAILRCELMDRMERVRDKPCINRDYYEATLAMYEAYHDRGGNGVVDKEWGSFERKALCSN